MPSLKPHRVRTRDQMVDHAASDRDAIERAISELARNSQRQDAEPSVVLEGVDLVVGDNRITHNLGRTPRHVSLMPTAADATFAWAVTERDERQMVIAIVGVDQMGASLEVT